MSKKKTHPKEYTLKELYEGYYWLILHTSPYHGPDSWRGDGGHITEHWKTEMPDCVKTAIKENITLHLLEHTTLSSGGYLTMKACSIDGALSWFTNKGIPLLNVGEKSITCLEDLKRLWTEAAIVDSYGRKIFLTEADYVKKALTSTEIYSGHSKDVFNALEHYFAKQHKENLEKAEDTKTLKLDKKDYTAKEIAKLLSIALTTFYTLPSKLQDFPEPVDPKAKVNRRWSKEAVEKIHSAYQKYKEKNPRTPPVKSAVPTRSKKHREHPKRKVRK